MAKLPLSLVLKLEPIAEALGVSKVARSNRGFVPRYVEVGGVWKRMTPYWQNRQQGFVARHRAQQARTSEKSFVRGIPTRRELALAMWADGNAAKWRTFLKAYPTTPEAMVAIRSVKARS